MFNNKRNIILPVLILCLIAIFTLTYRVSLNKYENNDKNLDVMAGISSKLNLEKDSIKIKLVTKYTINDVSVDEYIVKSGEEKEIIVKMSEGQIKNMFKNHGYKFKDINSEENEIVYIKEVDKYRYAPNKYVIGIKENEKRITIFKTDDKGNLNQENGEIKEIKIEYIPEKIIDNLGDEESDEIKMKDLPKILIDDLPNEGVGYDVENLTKGHKDYQFDTLQEAVEYLYGIFRS